MPASEPGASSRPCSARDAGAVAAPDSKDWMAYGPAKARNPPLLAGFGSWMELLRPGCQTCRS